MNRPLFITLAGAAILSLAAPLLAPLTGVLDAGPASVPYVGADASGGSAGGTASGNTAGGGGGH